MKLLINITDETKIRRDGEDTVIRLPDDGSVYRGILKGVGLETQEVPLVGEVK